MLGEQVPRRKQRDLQGGWRGVCLYFQYRVVLTEAEQGFEGGKGVSHADVQRNIFLAQGTASTKVLWLV